MNVPSMLLDLTECQLVLVDYQERLMPVMATQQEVLANALRLAQAAAKIGRAHV